MITRPVFIMAILFVVAVFMTEAIYRPILKIARQKGLVDNPEARKLQKEPVPVMGGLAVFFGIVVALCFFKTTVNYVNLFSTVCAMMVMLYIGSIDDLVDLKAWAKFGVEILVCLLVIYGTRNLMINFQDLFHIGKLPLGVAIPLTVIGMVGIINAINMIDGVDGLSSGMSIFIFGCLSLFLFLTHEYSYCALSIICMGALVPFFIHNVFGKSTKMFIGDGGALMIGVAIASLIINILRGRELAYTGFVDDFSRINLVSMCLAILSVPVFDTLRVMTVRMLRHQSPFHADKMHLHHCLLAAGLSHIRTTLVEIGLDAVVVLAWLVSVLLGAPATLQFLLVAGMALLSICGISHITSSRSGK